MNNTRNLLSVQAFSYRSKLPAVLVIDVMGHRPKVSARMLRLLVAKQESRAANKAGAK